jgi:hypothetical protein
VQTHRINVLKARDRVQEIRHELFKFPEVLEVFVTGRPDWLVVVSRGRPRPGQWLPALRAVGCEVPGRRHAVTEVAGADLPRDAAPPGAGPGWVVKGRASRRGRSPAVGVLASDIQAGHP